MAGLSSRRIKKTPVGKTTEDTEGRIKTKLTKMQQRLGEKFLHVKQRYGEL